MSLAPIGIYSFSYDSGIELLKIEHGIEDYAVFRWVGPDEERGKITRSKIHYSMEDNESTYFITKGHHIPLNEIIKIN